MNTPELATIVDENDNIIGYKDRNTLSHTDIFRITVVWIEDGKGNVLIHKRASSKKICPNYWENAAGGGVAKNETYEQNAYKELEEEIGLSGITLDYVTTNLIETTDGKRRFCAWYRAVVDQPIENFTIDPREVAEIKWVAKEQLFDHRDKNPELYMPSSMHWRQLFS